MIEGVVTMGAFVRAVTPQMVDSWAKFITKVGAWTALAGYLAYVLVGEIRADVKETTDMLRNHTGITEVMVDQQGVVIELLRRQMNVLTQDCVNGAETVQRRDRCFDVLNGAQPK